MRVSHFFEWEEKITGGIKQSVENQRKILDEKGIEYTTEPDLSADILHLNLMGPRSVYWALKARRRDDTKVVIHTHQTSEDFEDSFKFSNILAKPMTPYLKFAYSLGDLLLCPSDHNRDVIERYTDVEKKVISNGFNHERLEGFEDLEEEYLEKYDLEPPVVFCVGHVFKRKGLPKFIETARELPEVDFAWFGWIDPVQSGFKGRMLKGRDTRKLIEDSPDNCTFTGYIEDVRGAFAAGDIFFFLTKNENEGMALLESMGCGKPPVIRDIETFQWLEDGENCLKADEDFSEAIQSLVNDEQKRKELGEAAREKSKEFRLENVGDELVSIYRDITG